MFNSSELTKPLSIFSEFIDLSAANDAFPLQAEGYYDLKLFFLREGRLAATLGGKELSMRSGDVLIVCPGVPFAVRREESGAEPRGLLVRLDPSELLPPPCTAGWNAVFAEACRQDMAMCVSPEQMSNWPGFEIAEACINEYRAHDFAWETMAFTGLNQLCVLLLRFWQKQGLKLPLRSQEEDPLAGVTGYIHRNIQNGIRVEELAARCNLSYPWFAKRFREIYGISCKEYIEAVRVARVEQYLRYTDMDLAEISEITGYADCSHMIKNFKRLRSMTPGRYRIVNKG